MSLLQRYGKRAAMLSLGAARQAVYMARGLVQPTVTIATRQGRLTMPTRDQGIAAALYRWRQYEYDYSIAAIRFLKETGLVPRERVVMLDVGANIGVISTGLLLANEIAHAIAIEPEPNNFALLLQNVKQNGLDRRMTCLQLAVGEHATTLTMELSPDNPGDHRIRSRPSSGASERQNESTRQTVQVPSFPLPQVLERPEVAASAPSAPSVLWIDVQGYEGYVFAGARQLLGAGMPAVSEVWPYGILRSGMDLQTFEATVRGIWTDYWVFRRDRFIRYPISVFGRFLDELGTDGYFENVILSSSPSNP